LYIFIIIKICELKIIILKNGTDVFGKKIEILINGEIIEKISENIEEKEFLNKENVKIIDIEKDTCLYLARLVCAFRNSFDAVFWFFCLFFSIE